MFIPQQGDFFHIYTEDRGLLKDTIFECEYSNSTQVVGTLIVANGNRRLMSFPRNRFSFWPVQPGYREHVSGQPAPNRFVPAEADFVKQFKTMIKIRS